MIHPISYLILSLLILLPASLARAQSAPNPIDLVRLTVRVTAINAEDTDGGMCPNEVYFVGCVRPKPSGATPAGWTCMSTKNEPVPVTCGDAGDGLDPSRLSGLDVRFEPAVPKGPDIQIVIQAWEADPISYDQWDLDPTGGDRDMNLDLTYNTDTRKWSGDTSESFFGPGDSPSIWRRAKVWFTISSPAETPATAEPPVIDPTIVMEEPPPPAPDIQVPPPPPTMPDFDAESAYTYSSPILAQPTFGYDPSQLSTAPSTPPPPPAQGEEPTTPQPPDTEPADDAILGEEPPAKDEEPPLTIPDGLGVARATSNSVILHLPAPSSVILVPEPGAAEGVLVAQGEGLQVVTGLAPSADYFFRVDEAVLHARTVGGPRAKLDTTVREVHGYAPNILMIVVANPGAAYRSDKLQGNLGPLWQAGPWTVKRRDGSAIKVLRVHRHSITVSQPDYKVGYSLDSDINIVDVDHRLFLVLEQAIGSPDILEISGPMGLHFVLPFSDRYLETPVIQLNQVGYSPRATERYAYVSGWMGNGGPLSLANFPASAEMISDSGSVTPLALEPRAARDSDAGTEVHQISLASVPPAEGVRYRVRIPGVGVSWPTQVSETAVFKSFYTVMRGLTYNRWGRKLDASWTEFGPRPSDHPTVFTSDTANWTDFHRENTPQTGERAMVGGHHDAGDFDIRPSHTIVGLFLMRAFENHPDFFPDRQLTIPESGNGIPDLLDEALWSLAGWEHLQEADGGVRQGVESYRHPWGIYYADTEPLPYWTYSREANHTMRVAGLFAQASRLIQPYDEKRAAMLRARALAAWSWAVTHGASAGPKFYAAGELYRLTGELSFRNIYDTLWMLSDWSSAVITASVFPWFSSYMIPVQPALIDYLLGYMGGAAPKASIVAEILANLTKRANDSAAAVNGLHAHRNGRPASYGTDWGAGTAVGEYVIPAIQRLQFGGLSTVEEQSYINALSLSADYILGANPNGMVWMTALGSHYPREPLHLDTLSFLKDGQGLLPGIPVYGPIVSAPMVWYYEAPKAGFYPDFGDQPLGRRFVDSRTFVNTSEFDNTVQARHAELFAALLGAPTMPPASWLPGGSDHKSTLP
ncbi:MAG: glycoside hydrolase family 9 protein [Nitrospirae bacterium]|nr:glycoside hydrolase family 9 protein [Nitrospirota bacterium]